MTRHFEPLDVFECPLTGIRQIEASAGTGKTWNICGLYLRLLLERRLEVPGILVVTFTNAATAELRERIRQRIVDTLAVLRPERGAVPPAGDDFVARLLERVRRVRGDADATYARELELALATFDEAAIFTIHGFSQRALADTPFAAGMPLHTELAPDDARWVAEAANDFWRRRVAAEDLDPALAAHLVDENDSPARYAALLKRHLAKPMARPIWPDAAQARFDEAAFAAAHATARAMWPLRRGDIRALLARPGVLHGSYYGEASLDAAFQEWDALLQADAADLLGAPLDKAELLGITRLEKHTRARQATPRHAFFELAQTLLDQREHARRSLAHRRLELVRAMLAEGADAQRAAKRRQRVVAFDDMLSNLFERLREADGPRLAAALRRRFPAALIDEFQDTDPLQFAIFKAVYADAPADAGEPAPLFFVGDPKQAIYSFRNADLHTYLEAGGHALAHYSLQDNQRSSEALIAALNHLFEANPAAFLLPGLAYQRVRFGAKPRKPFVDRSGGAQAALQVWWLPEDDTGAPASRHVATTAVERATTAEIARLLAAGERGEVTLAGRPLAAGDIAVLVRSNAQGARMRRALSAAGVGSVELSQASVFESPDAEELERVLAAVLEPARERTLRAALATEAMGRDAAALQALAADEAALLAVVQRFAAYRETWLARGVGVMLREWMAAERVAARLLARPDGERRLTNLLHLVECLHDAARLHAAPDALLGWLQSQRSAPDGGDATQLRLESDRNLVQIVTIHKSKGLEYPVVFCPFLWTPGGGPGDGLDGVAYHDDDGHAVIDYGYEFLDKAAKEDIKARRRLEESAETLRLIYVALTRAVHRCVIAAGGFTQKTGGEGVQSTTSLKTMLHWLVAGAGMTPAQWFDKNFRPDHAAVRAAWQALAEGSGGALSLAPIPRAAPVPLAPRRAPPDSLAALAPPHPLPLAWRIGSFSALAHGARHDESGVDHDRRVPDEPAADLAPEPVRGVADLAPGTTGDLFDALAAAEVAPRGPADDDILDFPRGPGAGEAIHRAFESAAFDAPASWPAAVAEAVRLLHATGAVPPPATPAAQAELDARHARMLGRLLADVLGTPLPLGTPTPLRLAELAGPRRLAELEFHLPAHRVDAHALDALLREGGYALPRLTFPTLRGFLKGFIDLVFEHEGRWFVLDWKSNHLGDTPARYGAAPLDAAMRDQGYHLQALLYLVALDRLLRHRLPGYTPATHLGGAVYLFVRGVRPDWTDPAGRPAGVHVHRPAPAFLRRLSALFDAPRGQADGPARPPLAP